jgi:hypothetical protein
MSFCKDYALVKGVISPWDICHLMPGQLSQNASETNALQLHLSYQASYENMIHQMFSCDVLRHRLETCEDYGYQWTEDDWLCTWCLRRFIADHIVSWWSNVKTSRST